MARNRPRATAEDLASVNEDIGLVTSLRSAPDPPPDQRTERTPSRPTEEFAPREVVAPPTPAPSPRPAPASVARPLPEQPEEDAPKRQNSFLLPLDLHHEVRAAHDYLKRREGQRLSLNEFAEDALRAYVRELAAARGLDGFG